MSAKSRLSQLLDRPGWRPLLQTSAGLYLSVKRRARCTVRLVDGDWAHYYPDGIVVNTILDSTTPAMLRAECEDVFLHRYAPKPGDTVLDIGAGTGTEAVVFSQKVGQMGRVIAFEAHPRTFHCLQLSCSLNDCSNVTPINVALAAEPGELVISDLEAHPSNTVMSASESGVRICSAALDSFLDDLGIDTVAFLKMNIEGAERLAIGGMTEAIRRTENVSIACHDFWAEASGIPEMRTRSLVHDFLLDNGFRVAQRPHDPRPWVRDFLYGWRAP